ncbi:MAG: TonB-dependent receptor [Acidobacteria bacterium]|nr:TonB-dependent receptor [Acidobacteriota bacterium]
MSNGLRATLLALIVVGSPVAAGAQSAIVGVVRDSSGGVLPGVTVEATSDALIERTRAAVTDEQGTYRIVDLRPGTYVVTFSLPGFNSFRRDDLLLASEFTATVNADLKVGALEETITVTGAAPVVDVTTAARAQVLDREAIDSIPTGRSIQGMAQLVPGVSLNLPDTGGARAMQQTYMSVRGMSTSNTTMLVDGMLVNGLQSDGAVQSYFNDAMNSEVSIQVSGISADTSAGGVRMNMIPREGGNRFSGDLKASYRPGNWQSSNLTDRHVARGLRAGNAIDRILDSTLSLGGPIRKDRLWFFTSGRYFTVNNYIANTFFNDGSRGLDDQYIGSAMARLTWQISSRSKLSAYFDEIDKYRGHDMQSNDDPEEASLQWFSPAYHTGAIKYTSTLTNAMLLEAGYSRNLEYYTNSYQDGVEQPRGTAAWFAGASRLESDLGGRRTAATAQNTQSPERHAMQASLSYLWRSHSFKAGAQLTWGDFWHTVDANADLTQQYRSNATGIRFSVPDSVIIRNTPLRYGERLNRDLGFYVQDSWRLKRLTVNAGIRWEQIKAQVLASESPAGRFVPARSFSAIENLPNWTDWAPRFSAILDVFGNGRTAVKYSLNRYNQIRTTGIAGNYNPLLSQTATLPWRDANGNDIAEGERGCTGYPRVGCEIDFTALSPNFGIAALNEYGRYPRTWNFENAVEVQHELLPGFSLSGAVYRGEFRNLTTTINQNWTLADYTPFTFYNPARGQPFEVFARSVAAQARPARFLDTYDPQRRRQYQALMTNLTWRIPGGGQVFGGYTMERERQRACTAPDDPNYAAAGSRTTFTTKAFCDDFVLDIPWKHQFKLSGTRQIGWGFDLSMAFQSNQSPNSSRLMNVTRGVTRYPATCPAPCPANQIIMPTGTFGQGSLVVYLEPERATFVERIVQLDLKLQRRFTIGRVSLLPVIEVFNVNNSDAIISFVTTNALSNSYLVPNSIMQGRILGVGLTTRW